MSAPNGFTPRPDARITELTDLVVEALENDRLDLADLLPALSRAVKFRATTIREEARDYELDDLDWADQQLYDLREMARRKEVA